VTMNVQVFAQLGGVFAILVFWHFFADWVFQSHKEAMNKSKNWDVRAMHCMIYTLFFIPLLAAVGISASKAAFCVVILYCSHFVIDTYVPVMLWAKYLRLAPQFDQVKSQIVQDLCGPCDQSRGWSDRLIDRRLYASDEEAFKAFASTPLGLVLMITMDQLFHIAFLLPVAWLMIAT